MTSNYFLVDQKQWIIEQTLQDHNQRAVAAIAVVDKDVVAADTEKEIVVDQKIENELMGRVCPRKKRDDDVEDKIVVVAVDVEDDNNLAERDLVAHTSMVVAKRLADCHYHYCCSTG